MPDSVANPNVDPDQYSPFWFRFLEILPGAAVWTAILGPLLLANLFPFGVTIFVIAFDVFWLQKAIIFAVMVIMSYHRRKISLKTAWLEKLNWLAKMSVQDREERGAINPNELYHVVIYATYKEGLDILVPSIDSVLASDFDKQRTILVLATEERDAENAAEVSSFLVKKFGHQFARFIVTLHPANIIGEVKGKGANVAWAARELTRQIDEMGIALDRVIVTTADADTRFVPNYFSCLAYHYAINPKRTRCAYQPVAEFVNNIWDASFASRIMAFATTFWQMTESINDYRLITFSTHAMSLKTLVDIDYWCVSVVNEDSRQFFRAYFHYEGDFRSVPLYMPVFMDAVHVHDRVSTWKNLYYQQQRWAYGAEHFPYIVLESFRHKKIPLIDRLTLVCRAFTLSFFWPTNFFFIFVDGWLPVLLNHSFRDQIVVSNFPTVTSFILSATWMGTLTANFVSLLLLPPRPKHKSFFQYAWITLQWFLVPIAMIFFSSLPSIDAITRLMLGRYIGFRVTEKKAATPVAVSPVST